MNTLPTDISAVIPEYKTLTIAGGEVVIRQIKLGQIPAVLRAVQPITHMLKQDQPLDLQSMFMLYAGDCLTLLQVLSGKPADWINALDIDDGIRLFTSLLEVNIDFFVLRILPLLPEVMGQLRAKAEALTAQAGQTASKASSKTATA